MSRRPGQLLLLESSSCPLDDTSVGLRRHRNQSATGTGSDSQSITGTYRTPLSSWTNHIFGTTAPSVLLSCVLLPPSVGLFLMLSLASSPSSVYLSLSGKKERKKKTGWNTWTEKKWDRREDARTSAPLASGWPAKIPAHTNNRSLKTPRDYNSNLFLLHWCHWKGTVCLLFKHFSTAHKHTPQRCTLTLKHPLQTLLVSLYPSCLEITCRPSRGHSHSCQVVKIFQTAVLSTSKSFIHNSRRGLGLLLLATVAGKLGSSLKLTYWGEIIHTFQYFKRWQPVEVLTNHIKGEWQSMNHKSHA